MQKSVRSLGIVNMDEIDQSKKEIHDYVENVSKAYHYMTEVKCPKLGPPGIKGIREDFLKQSGVPYWVLVYHWRGKEINMSTAGVDVAEKIVKKLAIKMNKRGYTLVEIIIGITCIIMIVGGIFFAGLLIKVLLKSALG